jgi:hypothetical protein
MRLSVIIPVYNERHSLGATLKVVARTLPNIKKESLLSTTVRRMACANDNFSNGPRKGSSVDFDNDKRGINLTLKSGLNEAMTKLTGCGSKIPFW